MVVEASACKMCLTYTFVKCFAARVMSLCGTQCSKIACYYVKNEDSFFFSSPKIHLTIDRIGPSLSSSESVCDPGGDAEGAPPLDDEGVGRGPV